MDGKHLLHILIDTGSTHNFLDTKAAKRVGCEMISTSTLQVSVANGQKLLSTHECPQFIWNIHVHKFVFDAMILPLGGCDVVLSIQWLTTLDDIKWNFKKLVMEFEYNMKRVILMGTRDITLHSMQGKKVHKEPEYKWGQLYSIKYCIYPVSYCQMERKKVVIRKLNHW